MVKIYLGHSVHERDLGKRLQKFYEASGFEVYNPFTEEPNMDRWDGEKKWCWGVPYSDEESEDLVNNDFQGILWCDEIVLLFPNGPTIGMPCEMMYGWMNDKQIFSIVPRLYYKHPWINYLSTEVVPRNSYLESIAEDIYGDIL